MTRHAQARHLRRVNAALRCPVCGHRRGCGFASTWAVCIRVPSERTDRTGRGYIHAIQSLPYDTTERLLEEIPLLFHSRAGDPKTRRWTRRIYEQMANFLGPRFRIASFTQLLPSHVAQFLEAERARGISGRTLERVLYLISWKHAQLPARLFRGDLGRAVEAFLAPSSTSEAPVSGRTKQLLREADQHVNRLRRWAPSTRKRYRSVWRRFARWLGDSQYHVETLSRVRLRHVEAYAKARMAQGISEEALAWELNALQGLFDTYAKHEGFPVPLKTILEAVRGDEP